MSDDLFLNDTLDNFTFEDSVTTALVFPVKRLSNPNNVCTVSKTECNSNKNRKSLLSKNDISFDDSFFLGESMLLTQQCLQKETENKVTENCSGILSSACTSSPNRHKSIEDAPGHSNNINLTSLYNNSTHSQRNTVESECMLSSADISKNVQFTDKGSCTLLSSWSLPEAVLEKYASKNIKRMFHWQAECLSKKDVLHNNKNLVYSAPTSAGKTLVAEILAMKTIFEKNKKVIFILPFISIVREKMYYYQDILTNSGIRVDGFMGSHNPPGGFHSVQFAICTIEKANSLINKLLEEGKLSDLGTVLVDEMHLLGDPSRGYLLELLLTKLKYISLKDKDVQIQIIGMSATLPNLSCLANWLDAELYTTTFRPVPLDEQVIESGNIYDSSLKLVRKLDVIAEIGKDTDNILQLCLETIRDSCSVLIFCPTKNWCENLAEQLAIAFFKIGNSQSEFGQFLRDQIKAELIVEVLEQLKYCPVGLDEVLRKTVAFGVAFHHAGLTMDERDIIEGAFRNGAVRILIATSTLSSGVNLPARRVIIRTPNFHGKPIDILIYRQMIGRAGRMGKDSMGESFLVCQKNDFKTANELVSGDLHPVESCLEGEGKLKRAILEVIASGVASSPDDVNLFTKCTLLAASEYKSKDDIENPIKEAISFLKNNEFIRLQQSEEGIEKYVATSLGKACLTSSMPPDEGLALFSELDRARQCFVLETELHLIYLVTPYNACHSWGNIDWMLYLDLWEKLSLSMKRVGELVGIKQSYLVNAARGKIQSNTSKLYHQLLVHKRFFVALALQDLVNEKSLSDVCLKFNCNRGMLQSLQQSASSFAGMVTSFCKELGWHNVEILLSQFQDRLQFGVSHDLLDLMRLPLLNGKMARILYNAGIDTLVQLANSNTQIIENIFHKSVPFESSKEREGESEFAQKQRNKFRRFWINGKDGMNESETAELVVNSARNYLKLEMGLADAKWDPCDKGDSTASEVSSGSGGGVERQNISSVNDSLTKQVESLDINNSPKLKNIQQSVDNLNIKNKEQTISKYDIDQIISVSSSDLGISNCSIFTSTSSNYIEENSGCKSNTSTASLVVSNVPEEKVCNSKIQPTLTDLSDNSIFGSSVSLKSDQSIFNESLNLQLSLSGGTEDKNVANGSINYKSDSDQSLFDSGTFLERAFSSSFEFDEQKIQNTVPENILSPSIENHLFATPNLARKRSRRSQVTQDSPVSEGTPSKKQKPFQKSDSDNFFINNASNSSSNNAIESGTANFSKINIVDISVNTDLLNIFEKEIKSINCIALSIACSRVNENKPVIGVNIIQTRNKTQDSLLQYTYEGRRVDGLAIVCNDLNVYYISFDKQNLNSRLLKIISDIFTNSKLTVKMFSSKQQIKVLKNCCNIDIQAKVEDPKIADWLLDPEGNEKNLHAMVLTYSPEVANLAKFAGSYKDTNSLGLNLTSSIESKIRSSLEAVITWQLTDSIKNVLTQTDPHLIKVFEIEMETIKCLAKMEVMGISIDKVSMQNLIDRLKNLLAAVENKAYSLAGRRFNFLSSKDVAKTIGIFQGKKMSTRKQVLEQSSHPISDLVLQWRKISCTLTKMLYPIIRDIKNGRIHGCYVTHTSTGRITMHEPNLQNITKDFVVKNPQTKTDVLISCRSAFSLPNDYILVSTDYCQLELRILTHLSGEKLLKNIMRKPGDVFRSIAAKWNRIDENDVTDEIRQNTKHICYGLIYGMGEKTLAEQLGKPEEDVLVFMETFRNTYPGIQKFIKDTIKFCAENGYVQTMMGRKRFLPCIKDPNPALKAQAERQAVNTCVQGTAADIAKQAMVAVEKKIAEVFKKSRHKPHITLHLHDELICETPKKYLNKVACIMRKCMENAVKLSVPLPVKIKIGKSWGELTEYEL